MSKTEINNALSKGRSQFTGRAIDDSIILEFKNFDLIETTGGEEAPLAFIIQKLTSGTDKIKPISEKTVKGIHLPEQIKYIDDGAFSGCTDCEKINIKNVEYIGSEACAGLAQSLGKPIEVHLDNAKEIGIAAFIEANAEIFLNKDVEKVQEDAFISVRILHYKGTLEGAPWGAQVWIKD